MSRKKRWHVIVKEGMEVARDAGTFPTKHAALLQVSEDYGPDPDGGRVWPSGVEDFIFESDNRKASSRLIVFVVPMYEHLPYLPIQPKHFEGSRI